MSEQNARFIANFFRNKGWTLQAICGMLGNMQAESGIIADKHENGGGGGYGLVQWTPMSKLTDWARANGLDHRSIETQCKRIQWEVENNQQWISTRAYNMSFRQFTQSTSSPNTLAMAFLLNYERPSNQDQPQRGINAQNWFSRLGGGPAPQGGGHRGGGRWLPPVTGANTNDSNNGYAGIIGQPIDAVAVSGGHRYRVHLLGGNWLPEVTGYNQNDSNNGYAGIIGRKIDAFMIQGVTCRCHTDEGWYPAVTGYNTNDSNNGYAGKFGHPIDAILIYGVQYQVHI